jgi:hypothetical protein
MIWRKQRNKKARSIDAQIYEYMGIVSFSFGSVFIQINIVSESDQDIEDLEAIEALLIKDARHVLEKDYGIDFSKHFLSRESVIFPAFDIYPEGLK